MRIRALTWNLYHGRDFPPDPSLHTWRSRLRRTTERNETHAQVNRELLGEFAATLAGADWDLALLQECPPRWAREVAAACAAESHLCLTSRNLLPPLQSLLARLNPDLIASWEGGSNLTLVRREKSGALGSIGERREVTLRRRPLLRRQPERRTMALTRLGSGICVANLHASRADPPSLPEEELRRAAQAAIAWAREAPLILGGDLNLGSDSAIFDELARRHGLRPPTPVGIDHLLARGLEVAEAPAAWSPGSREVRGEEGSIRLSDHPPVEATFALPAGAPPPERPFAPAAER